MSKTYTIKKISELFNIPKSTLRYWESEGIIKSIRNNENNYREYSSEDLIKICDILFYRNLNIPIKQLYDISDKSIDETQELLIKSKVDIENKINELESIKLKIDKSLENIKLYNYLKENPYKKTTPPFNTIIHLHLAHTKNVLNYINDNNLLAFCIDANDDKITHYGIASNNDFDEESKVLWTNENSSNNYIECLLKTNKDKVDLEYLKTHLDYINSINAKPKAILAKYILSDKLVDYFHAWIEID